MITDRRGLWRRICYYNRVFQRAIDRRESRPRSNDLPRVAATRECINEKLCTIRVTIDVLISARNSRFHASRALCRFN